ncbi:MAG: glycosyltransferase [Candidatus Micrarchaeia archaeon]
MNLIGLKRELSKRGYKVLIFAPGDRKIKEKNKDPNVFYYSSIPFFPYPSYRFALMPYSSEKELRRHKVDIIHSYGMGTMGMAALICSRLIGLPIIGTMPTNIQEATHYIVGSKRMQEFAKIMVWKYLRFYYNRCDKILALSKSMAQIYRKNGLKNVIVTPWGIDLDKYRPGKFRKIPKGGKVNILYLGRIVKEKNLDVVIKSALLVAEKENVHFTIVGGGPAEQFYKDMVKKEGVEHLFTFVGPVKHDETVKYYHSADIFVFPSIFETQGLAGLEAMACGLPVVGANYLAIPDFVKDGYNGYLFDPFDPDDCAEKVIKTIKERKKLREGAIKTSRKYSLSRCTEILLKVYRQVLKRKREILKNDF